MSEDPRGSTESAGRRGTPLLVRHWPLTRPWRAIFLSSNICYFLFSLLPLLSSSPRYTLDDVTRSKYIASGWPWENDDLVWGGVVGGGILLFCVGVLLCVYCTKKRVYDETEDRERERSMSELARRNSDDSDSVQLSMVAIADEGADEGASVELVDSIEVELENKVL